VGTGSGGSRRVPSLDGLRAVSITAVIVSHVVFEYRRMHDQLFVRLLSNLGPLGVSVFFGISGFIITTLLIQEKDATGRIDLGAFYIRRVFRILPPFYVYLGVVALIGPRFPLAHFRNALLFVTNYTESNWWLGHSWSLSVEEQFYLLWPFTVVVSGSRSTRIATWLILLAPAFRIASHILRPDISLNFMFHTRFDSLMVGCVLALERNAWRTNGVWRFLGDGRVASLSVAFLVFVSPLLTERLHGLYQFPIGMSLEALSVGSIILWSIEHANSGVGLVLNHSWIRHLGVVSYSLYLWQEPFFSTELVGTWVGRFPLNCLVPLGLAELSYRVIERPTMRLRDVVLHRYAERQRDREPSVAR